MNEPIAQSPFDTFIAEVLNQYAREPFDPKEHHPFHCIDAFAELELPLLTPEQRKAFLIEYTDRWLSVDESDEVLPPMVYEAAHPLVTEEPLPDAIAAHEALQDPDEDWEPEGVLAGGGEPIVGMTNMAICMMKANINLGGEVISRRKVKAMQHGLAAAYFDEGEIHRPFTIGNFNWAYTHLRIDKLPKGIEGIIPSPILPANVSLEQGVRDWFDFDLSTLPDQIRSQLVLLSPSECGLEMLRNGNWKPVSGVSIIGVRAA